MKIADFSDRMARHTAAVRGVFYTLVAVLERAGSGEWEGTAGEMCRVLSCTMGEAAEFLAAAWARGFLAVSVAGRGRDGSPMPELAEATEVALSLPELAEEARKAAARREAQRRRTAECRARRRDAEAARKPLQSVTHYTPAHPAAPPPVAAQAHTGAGVRAVVCEEYIYNNNHTHTGHAPLSAQAREAAGGGVCAYLPRMENAEGRAGIRPYPKSGTEVRQWIEAYRPDAAAAMTPARCQEFVDFGEATGWTVGSTPVRDWTKMISGKWLRRSASSFAQGAFGGWNPRRDFSGDYSKSEGGFRLFAD